MDDRQRGRSADNRGNRGRSAEARDPNRPVDPETGEKLPLPPRYPDDEVETPEAPEEEV